MAEPITREEFNQSLGRIHDKIDAIGTTSTEIKVSAQMMKESVDKICNCIYGNGKEGLNSKITKLFERISLHTKLITFVVLSILGIAFSLLQTHLEIKKTDKLVGYAVASEPAKK